jgi:hypothetical protein
MFGTSAGAFDHFTILIEEAWFGPNEDSDFDSETPQLHFRGAAWDEDGDEMEEQHVISSIGKKGWEVTDEGEGVEHASGKPKKFQGQTHVGVMLRTMAKNLDEDTFDEIVADFDSPMRAEFWAQGLKLELERHSEGSFKDDDGNEREYRPYHVMAAEKVKGKTSKGKGKSTSKGKAATKPTKAAEKALRAKVAKFAAKYDDDDHETFVDEALDKYPTLTDFDALHADVLDEDGDIWTEAH